MSDNVIQPTQKSERIPSLDFLRGVAIFGILFINAENFAYPDSWSPWKYGFDSTADHTTRFWVYFLTQGKFYTMFALLFGVGFYITLERLENKNLGLQAMDIYARRLLWLFIIGVGHAYLIWDGDVLYHYAICGFLLFPFRSIKSKNLILVVVLLGSLQLVKSYEQTTRTLIRFEEFVKASNIPKNERTREDIEKVEFWKNKLTKKDPDTSKVEIRKTTYLNGVKETYEHASVHKGLLYYQGLLFPSLIAMLLGVILYRSGIFTDYHVWRHYWLISIGILAMGLVINYLRFYHWTYQYFDPILSYWKGMLFTFPKELLGIGYILIFNGIYQKFLAPIKLKVVSKVGQMALTNYIFQNTLLGFVFYGYGLAKFNQYSRVELLGIVAGIWVIQILLSSLWMSKYKQGPLEWVWKELTYGSFKDKKNN